MKYVLVFVVAAVASWAVLSLVGGRDLRNAVHVTPARSSAGSVPEATIVPAADGTVPVPLRPFVVPARAVDTGQAETTLESLKLEDPWMADNLRQGLNVVVPRLVQAAWERGGRRDPACSGKVLMLAARVEARADEMTVTLDADDACARAYFAGHATVHDHEVGGPFPVTQLVVPVPVPQALSARLADRPDAP